VNLRTITLLALSVGALGVSAATNASAQAAVGSQSLPPDLSGLYRCVTRCAGPGVIRVVQRGLQLTLLDQTGRPAAAWIESPGHIRTSWREAAVYSADGFSIQFAGGMVWVLLEPTPIPGTAW
jgi:hypothetical protein